MTQPDKELAAFRLGDIRGIYPTDIDEIFVERFAHAFAGHFDLKGKVVTGRDMRESSEPLQQALNATLAAIGIDVIDIGLCPTELGYFAAATADVAAAIIVTASHNPARYNGLKCVLRGGRAITTDHGLDEIRRLMRRGYHHPAAAGTVLQADYHVRFLEFLGQHFSTDVIRSGAIALNGLNGTAATMADRIAREFGLNATWYRQDPGPIPAEGADPASPRLAAEMKGYMAGGGFALGVAWDGDCDRCVFFDNDGDLVPTYYMVGLMTEYFLSLHPGSSIVFDTKLCWNTLEIIARLGGNPVAAATGHAFMKEKMQKSGAVYGGELSSHHYFGDFFGCDSGMFAWLTVMTMLSGSGRTLQEMIAERKRLVCCTPEISISLADVDAGFAALGEAFAGKALDVDEMDGLAFSMPGDWRFSIRRSKTEDLIRLNFEARGQAGTLLEEGIRVLETLEPYRGDDADWLAGFQIQA